MARKFLTPITPPTLAEDPASGVLGSIYYNTTDDVLKIYDGSAWVSINAAIIEHVHTYDGAIYSVGGVTLPAPNVIDGGTP